MRKMKGQTPADRGTLYIVSTPIGNLEDLTLRALRVLREAALIAAEDTRRVRKLLSAYSIGTPVMSLYDQVEAKKAPLVVSRLSEGQDVAYVCDAGTPLVSDPGYRLIREALQAGIRVVPVPGPSAALAAISVSGLPTDRFVFLGFPPSRSGRRKELLASLRGEPGTLIFFESPRRVLECLEDIREIFGDRSLAVSRELTKKFEETLRGRVSELIEALRGQNLRGEFTLVVEGHRGEAERPSENGLKERILELRREGTRSNRDMVDVLAAETGIPRKEIYRAVLDLED